MSQLVDCYFLIDTRSVSRLFSFINRYARTWHVRAEDFPIPLYDDFPTHVFESLDDVFAFLEDNQNMDYSVYIDAVDSGIVKYLMVFHTTDAMTILGFSLAGRFSDQDVISFFRSATVDLESIASCLTVEEVPPDNATEFIAFCRERFHS